MKYRRLFVAIAAGVMLTFNACVDREGPTAPVITGNSFDRFAIEGGSEGRDLISIPRFELDLEVRGPLRPATWIEVDVTAVAKLATDDVELQIHVPEVESAKRSGWDNSFRVPVDIPLPPAALWRGRLVELESNRLVARFVVPRAGYYRVVVSAAARSEELPIHNGIWVQDAAVREIWLLVDEAGGRMTEQFEDDVFPEGILHIPGPFRSRRFGGNRPGLDSGGLAAVLGDTYLWEAVYWNTDVGAFRPVARAEWSVEFHDEDNGEWWVESGHTGSTGLFEINCVPYTADYDGSVDLRTTSVYVHGGATRILGDGYDLCNNPVPYQVVAPSDNGHVYGNMMDAAYESQLFLGRSRPRLNVYLSATADNSHYSPADDWVVIKTAPPTNSHVWGPWGKFVAAHEFGHAVHEKGLGGNAASGYCPSDHYRHVPSNLQCAYSEGFASHLATTITGVFRRDYEDNFYLVNNPDGAIVEGAVTAFFLDVTDQTNEGSHDSMTYPGSYVAALIESCYVTESGSQKRANGIDHIIYCMENQVDPAVTGNPNYFPTRSPDPTAYTESASEPPGWQQSGVRAGWVEDLYHNPPSFPPLTVYIDGSNPVQPYTECVWNASVSGGTAPFSYKWYRNSALVYTKPWYIGDTGGNDFTLELVVTDANSVTDSDIMGVMIDIYAFECAL